MAGLEATKETGGCERLWCRITDRADRPWSVPLVPRVGTNTLRALGQVEHSPSAPVLALVRHPYNRLVSAWRYVPTLEQWEGRWPEDWPEFIRMLMDSDPETLDRHLRPQVWFHGEHKPEKVLRFNMLSKHLTPVRGDIRKNVTPYNIPWPWYDDTLYRGIIDYYADDMACFMAGIG